MESKKLMNDSKTICVIEDNTPIRKLFATLLKKASFNVVDFDNGTDAVEWLRSNKVELILMDILLPDINGTELIKMVKAIPGFDLVPVVAVTGFAVNQDGMKFLELGFDNLSILQIS